MIINRIKTTLVSKWINESVIEEEEKELYEYGIEVTIEYMVNIITTIIIAFLTNEIISCLFFYGSFKVLRSFSGGVHAKTFFRCYIYSSLVILSTILLIKFEIVSIMIYRIGALVSIIYLLMTKPVASENKEIDEKEKKFFENKEKKIILIIIIISSIAFFGGFVKIEKALDSTFIISAGSIVLAKINECSKGIEVMKDAMINIAICDDEMVLAEKLKQILVEMEIITAEKYSIEVYASGEEILEGIEDGKRIDILFMDIWLKNQNGVDIAKKIKEIYPDILLVYVTAFEEYVYKVFETVPIGFIRKPFKKKDVKECLKRAIDILTKQDAIYVRGEAGIVRILVKDIVYICSVGRQVWIYDKHNRKYTQYGKLDDYEKRLSIYAKFIRIHKSNLVNFDYVERYEYKKIYLENNIELTISRENRKDVRERYLDSINFN